MPVLTDHAPRSWHSDSPPAITIQQPWAHAIVFGTPPKDVENRSWGTTYRGRLYIHAGVSDDPLAPGSAWSCGDAWHQHAHGAIIGYVTLADCVRNSGAVRMAATSPWADIEADWNWYLTDPVALMRPVPCQGKLGMWRVTFVQQTAIKYLDPKAVPDVGGEDARRQAEHGANRV